MNWINRERMIAFIVVVAVSLISIKIADWGVGRYLAGKTASAVPQKRSLVMREYAPMSNGIVTPSEKYLSGTQNLAKKEFRIRTDQNAFIVGDRDFESDMEARPVDMIFFGGSTTECLYVDEDQRFPYLVGENLRTGEYRNLHILNGGVSGNHTMHAFLRLIAGGLPAKPGFVVLMEDINDLSLLGRTSTYWDAPSGRTLIEGWPSMPATHEPSVPPAPGPINLLAPNIWQLVQKQLATPATDTTDEWAPYRERSQKIDSNAAEREYRASITMFVRSVKAWGSTPILMTQFNRLNLDDAFIRQQYELVNRTPTYEDFVAEYKRFNQIIREVASSENVFLIDLDKTIPHTSDVIYDAVHVNNDGSRLVARTIAGELARQYPQYFTLN